MDDSIKRLVDEFNWQRNTRVTIRNGRMMVRTLSPEDKDYREPVTEFMIIERRNGACVLPVEEYQKLSKTKKAKLDMGMFYGTNNARKMHGLPLHRKKDKRKRFYTRNKADEALDALWYYWEN